ncbi:MAG: TraR/DksA C4-type zinc finger protein [Solirubrobacterales bacterium]
MKKNLVKIRLLAERERLQRSIQKKVDMSKIGLKAAIDELSVYDQHMADIGTETFEREKDLGLLEMLEQRLGDVNHALEALDNGRYGICEDCGRMIDPRRMERLPYATRCMSCSQKEVDGWGAARVGLPPDFSEIIEKGDKFTVGGEPFYADRHNFYRDPADSESGL